MTLKFSTPNQDEIDTVVLFEIDSVEYRVPAKPRAGIALQYMKESRNNNDVAVTNLLINLLGEDNYDTLTNWDGLSFDILQAIITACVELMSGPVEDPKDSMKRSTRKSA